MKTIMLVDDSPFDRQLLATALTKKMPLKLLEASRGSECLALLQKEKVDLVLLDIMMPGELGSEILEKIRSLHNAIELPVVMVTAKVDTAEIVDCLRRGANDYITKPVNFEIAIMRISTHLKLSETSHEISRLLQLAALDAVVTTYNHEINNPLTIALGYVDRLLDQNWPDAEKIQRALSRIQEIVKKIDEINERKEMVLTKYVNDSKIIKIR